MAAHRPFNPWHGQARIYIDEAILKADFAKTQVHPPSGSQASITVVQHLLEEALVSRKVDICLAPDGGFHVQLAHGASGEPVQ